MSRRWLRAAMPAIAVAAILQGASSESSAAQRAEKASVSAWLSGRAIGSGNFGAAWTFAPAGLHQGGIRWQASAQRGYYEYVAQDAPGGRVLGRYTDVSLGIGYELSGTGYGAGLTIGPTFYEKDLNRVLPVDRVGRRYGAKATVHGYYGGRWATAFGFASFSSADKTANAFANLGFPLPGGLSIGPEVGLQSSSEYRQTRLGLHLGGLQWRSVRFGLTVGRTRDMNGNRGSEAGMSLRSAF